MIVLFMVMRVTSGYMLALEKYTDHTNCHYYRTLNLLYTSDTVLSANVTQQGVCRIFFYTLNKVPTDVNSIYIVYCRS